VVGVYGPIRALITGRVIVVGVPAQGVPVDKL